MAVFSILLVSTELMRWWRGAETHNFAVEKGVSRDMLLNLDVVVRMNCADLHINVQDAAGDRILAAHTLSLDPTNWSQWVDLKGTHKLGRDAQGKVVTGHGWEHRDVGKRVGAEHEEGFGEEHVHDIVAKGRSKAKFGKTPKVWGGKGDSCRVYGTLNLNKVQGDFHITARGHGYMELASHLDHSGTFPLLHGCVD